MCTELDQVAVSCVVWKDNKLSFYFGIGKPIELERYKKKKTLQKISAALRFFNHTTNTWEGWQNKLNDCQVQNLNVDLKMNMRLFYNLLDVILWNSWLLYIRVSEHKLNSNIMSLTKLREEVAMAMQIGKYTAPKRGRLSTELNLALWMKSKSLHVVLFPPKEVQKDKIGHWPEWKKLHFMCQMPNCNKKKLFKLQ